MDSRPLPPEALLRIAYLRISTRAWPRFESCMVDPLKSRILISYARRLESGKIPQEAEPPPAQSSTWRYKPRELPRGLDRKRLAAGEREDDSRYD